MVKGSIQIEGTNEGCHSFVFDLIKHQTMKKIYQVSLFSPVECMANRLQTMCGVSTVPRPTTKLSPLIILICLL